MATPFQSNRQLLPGLAIVKDMLRIEATRALNFVVVHHLSGHSGDGDSLGRMNQPRRWFAILAAFLASVRGFLQCSAHVPWVHCRGVTNVHGKDTKEEYAYGGVNCRVENIHLVLFLRRRKKKYLSIIKHVFHHTTIHYRIFRQH